MKATPWTWGLAMATVVATSTGGEGAELIYRASASPEQSKIAVATGQSQPLVTRAEMNAALAQTYYQIAQDLYERQQQWLRDFVPEQLIGLEAWNRKVSSDSLVTAETGVRPSDGERWEAVRRQYGERLWREAKASPILSAPAPPAAGGGGAELVYLRRTRSQLRLVPVVTVHGLVVVDRLALDDALSIAYYQAAKEVHRRRLAWLRPVVHERLLGLEAARKGVPPEELLRSEIRSPAVDDAGWRRAREAYTERLWEQARVVVALLEPDPPQVHAAEANTSPVLGLIDAPLAIIEFCSFTSPRCRAAWDVYREVFHRLGRRVRLAHRDAPEPGNPASFQAAVAARCAHRQAKFWSYHDLLLANQDKLADPATFKRLARGLGLDTSQFDRCLDKSDTGPEVSLDAREVRRLGLVELPTLFVNSTYVPGVLSADELIATLELLKIQ